MQASKCLELRVLACHISEEAFEQLAAELHALGTAEEADISSGTVERIAWLTVDGNEQAAKETTMAILLHHKLSQESVSLILLEQQDWETAWQKGWHAIEIGERIRVHPSFCSAPDDDRIDIVLDPSMAFGTGTHPTTQLCLEAIERTCTTELPATLLDMGAGSGILAIAAMKLGAGAALAIDMEQDSIDACQTNAEMNDVVLTAICDDTPPPQSFELVVANILAGPLIWMAKELSTCVDRHLILSGLLTTQLDDVAAAYMAAGLVESRRDSQGEWASIEFIRL